MTAEVRAELLAPAELDAAMARRAVVFVPLGSIEYHSHHLPVGLDGLTAHGVCTHAAGRAGGVVLPTLYHGTGGTHTGYPWTIMSPAAAPLDSLLRTTLERLAALGVRVAVLFTGHFADEQLALIDGLAADWNGTGSALRVLALGVNRSTAAVPPDHAGVFETSLLRALWPDLVRLDRLPALAEVPTDPPQPDGSWDHRHAAGHPLRGVMGPDPRTADLGRAEALLDEMVSWLCQQVDEALTVH